MRSIDPAASLPLRAETAAEFLAKVPMFAALEPSLRDAVAERARPVSVAAGAWLFHEGDEGDALYIVRAGRMEIVDEAAGTTIREIGRGDAVGELALLTGEPRAASVRAARAARSVRRLSRRLRGTAPRLPGVVARP